MANFHYDCGRIMSIENEWGLQVVSSRRGLPKSQAVNSMFAKIAASFGLPDNYFDKKDSAGNLLQFSAFLPNGSRIYKDRGDHIEHALPECSCPEDVITWDRAHELVMVRAASQLSCELRADVMVYKQNMGTVRYVPSEVSQIRQTYGCHENYLFHRDSFIGHNRKVSSISTDILRYVGHQMLTFLATRQIFTGSGVLLPETGEYCLSQRSLYTYATMSDDTTSQRGIFNLRNEPHADSEKYLRVHLILGDANMSEFQAYLKLGVTSIMLRMIEHGIVFDKYDLADPVGSLGTINKDLSLRRTRVMTRNGAHYSALELQQIFWEMADRFLDYHGASKAENQVMGLWGNILGTMEAKPDDLYLYLDWALKLRLMDEYCSRHNVKFTHPSINDIQLRYHHPDRKKGLYFVAERALGLFRITDDASVERALRDPPGDTRAHGRGKIIQQQLKKGNPAVWQNIDWTSVSAGDKVYTLPNPLHNYDNLTGIVNID